MRLRLQIGVLDVYLKDFPVQPQRAKAPKTIKLYVLLAKRTQQFMF